MMAQIFTPPRPPTPTLLHPLQPERAAGRDDGWRRARAFWLISNKNQVASDFWLRHRGPDSRSAEVAGGGQSCTGGWWGSEWAETPGVAFQSKCHQDIWTARRLPFTFRGLIRLSIKSSKESKNARVFIKHDRESVISAGSHFIAARRALAPTRLLISGQQTLPVDACKHIWHPY